MKILNEVIKNFRIIFRSWVSLALLILGPLALIFLIGFTFGEQEVHSPKIGIVTDNYESAEPFILKIKDAAQVSIYADISPCISRMREGKEHLCIEISQEEAHGESGLQRGFFTFHYDPAQNAVSSLIIKGVNELVGESAEQLSIEATQSILDNVQNMVSFLADKQSQIAGIVNESEQIRQSLVERRQKLEEIDSEFTPRYNEVKAFQTRLDASISSLNSSKQEIDRQKEAQEELIAGLQSLISQFPSSALYENASGLITSQGMVTYHLPDGTAHSVDLGVLPLDERASLILLSLNESLSEFSNATTGFIGMTDESYSSLLRTKAEINDTVAILDEINSLLDAETKFTNESIIRIDRGVRNIQNLSAELDQSLAQFAFIDPESAERIIRPVLQEYSGIAEITPVERVFSGLLVMVVVFITLLFANILTLSEINSEAYFRNLIAPVSSLLNPLGILITNVVLVGFQITVLLGIAQTKFNIPVFSHAKEIYLLSAALVLIFTLLGMAIACFFRNAQTSILTTTFTALAFYLFSSITTPLELMPELAASIAQFNPVVIAESLFRRLIIHNVSIFGSADLLAVLGVYLLAMLLLALLANRRMVQSFK